MKSNYSIVAEPDSPEETVRAPLRDGLRHPQDKASRREHSSLLREADGRLEGRRGANSSPREWLDDLRRKRLVRPASELASMPSLAGSGLPELDRVCGGGLPRGRISEVVIAVGGGATVLHALLASAARRGELAALVDPLDGFVAASAAQADVALERLLWVRPRGLKEALRAAEVILETGGFGLLVVDLWGWPASKAGVSTSAGLRLSKCAHKTRTVMVVLSARQEVGTGSSLTLEVRAGAARWGGRGERFLDAIDLSVHLRRRRYDPGD